MGHNKRYAVWMLIILSMAIAGGCVAAPAKSSDYPWINTNAIEYLQQTDAIAVQDATHFDTALSPERMSTVKDTRPGKQVLRYQIWRDTYVNEWAAFERQKQETWARNNGKNAEDFWCHFANDVTVSLSTGQKIIPGWDPANDTNSDDVRDWKSDYGRSTSAGSGYLQDTSKNWTSGEWTGHVLVDRAGNTFTITGNTSSQINVSGTPSSGRYGLSDKSAPNPRATAKIRAESRVRVHAWGDASFPDAWVQNYASQDYWDYRRYDVQQLIVEGNTSWDPSADTRWDGIFVDSTVPYYDWPTVADGAYNVLEYPNRSAEIYKQHTVNGMAHVKAGIGDKVICPNTCGLFPEAGVAGGAEFQENTVSFNSAQGPYKWDQWRAQNAKGVYCYTAYFFSYSDRAREQLHFLAHHYIAQEPYIYFGLYGFGYTPAEWFAAIEKDVGTAVESYSLWKSGTDPVGQSYNVYKRQYSKALILCRPMNPSGQSNFSDSSRVTFALPSYTTTSGGTSNRYYSLNADGTTSGPITSVGLRNVESAILFPADSATTPPPPIEDTTPPTISSVAAVNVGSTSATITWTTDEAAVSTVQYGTSTSYGTSVSGTNLVTSHSITLNGLQEGTTYHYRVQSRDAAGNTATSTDYVFTTAGLSGTAPFLREWLLLGAFSNPDRSGYTNNLIGETTVAPTAGDISDGLTWYTYSSTGDLIDLASQFTPNTDVVAYAHLYVNSPSAAGCQLWLGTDDGVKAWVNGTLVHDNFAYRPAVKDQDKVPISLDAGWNKVLIKVDQTAGGWGFYARICDSAGNPVPGLTFSAVRPDDDPPPPADTTPPAVSGVNATATSTEATVTWQTDEPATSIVEYGTSTAYGQQTSDLSLVTQHSARLTSLLPSTTYHYRVKSTDEAGNQSVSSDRTFATSAATSPAVFLRDWLLIGTFDNTDRMGFHTDYIGETTVVPSEGDVAGGMTWYAYRSSQDLVNLFGQFTPNTNAVAYAHLYVNSPVTQAAQLWLGSDDGIKVWVNGELVHENEAWRPVIKDEDKVQINLAEGWNSILLKVDNLTEGWGFTARICDAVGDEIPGLTYQLDNPAPAPGDTTPPAISGVNATATTTEASITWQTDEPATSVVEYGTTTAYGQQVSDPSLVTQHSSGLTSLSPSTIYHYRVKSTDEAGNQSVSTDRTFTTPALPDTTPPAITGVNCSVGSSTEATVVWETDEDATSEIEYGTSTAYGRNLSDLSLTTQHSIALTSLSADTTYHYRVKSTDAAGNQSVSEDYTFSTPAEAGVEAAFIRDWLLVGPFDNTNRVGFDTDYIGETTVAPSDGTVSGGAVWFTYNSLIDVIELGNILMPNENVVGYAHIYVNSPVAQAAQLWLGSDDGIKVWVNGELVHENEAWRPVIKDEDKVQINLAEGWNSILLKVDNLTAGWGFTARICDAIGNELPGVTYQLDNPSAPSDGDNTPPRVVQAWAADKRSICVVFDEQVTADTANAPENYSISPSLWIRNASLQADGRTVIVRTGWIRRGTTYTVRVVRVSDLDGNAIPTTGAVGNTASFTAY